MSVRANVRHPLPQGWRGELAEAGRLERQLPPDKHALRLIPTSPFHADVDYYWFPAAGVRHQTDAAWAKAIDDGSVDAIIGGLPPGMMLTRSAIDRRSGASKPAQALSSHLHP
jgi:hypothetical protein